MMGLLLFPCSPQELSMYCMPLLGHIPPITASHPSRNSVVEDCHQRKKSLVMARRSWFILHHALHDCTILHHAPFQGNPLLIFHGAGGQVGAADTERVGFAFLWWRVWVQVKGTVLPSVQVTACGHRWHHGCLPSLFLFEIYCMGNAASPGIESSNSAHANVTSTH